MSHAMVRSSVRVSVSVAVAVASSRRPPGVRASVGSAAVNVSVMCCCRNFAAIPAVWSRTILVAKRIVPQSSRTMASFTHHGSMRCGGTGAAGGGGGGPGGVVEMTCASIGIGAGTRDSTCVSFFIVAAAPFARRMPVQASSAMPTGVPVMEVGTPASTPSSRPLPRDLPQPSRCRKRWIKTTGTQTERKLRGIVMIQVATAQSAKFHKLSTKTSSAAASGWTGASKRWSGGDSRDAAGWLMTRGEDYFAGSSGSTSEAVGSSATGAGLGAGSSGAEKSSG